MPLTRLSRILAFLASDQRPEAMLSPARCTTPVTPESASASMVPAAGSHCASSPDVAGRRTKRIASKPRPLSSVSKAAPTSPEAPVTAIFPRLDIGIYLGAARCACKQRFGRGRGPQLSLWSSTLRILFIAPQAFADAPDARDVTTLAKVLRRADHSVDLVSPLYSHVDTAKLALARRLTKLEFDLGGRAWACELYTGRNPDGVGLTFIGNEEVLLSAESLSDAGDQLDASRVGVFASAVAELLKQNADNYDVVHAHGAAAGAVVIERVVAAEARRGRARCCTKGDRGWHSSSRPADRARPRRRDQIESPPSVAPRMSRCCPPATGHEHAQLFVLLLQGGKQLVRHDLATLDPSRGPDPFPAHLPALVHVLVHLVEKTTCLIQEGIGYFQFE